MPMNPKTTRSPVEAPRPHGRAYWNARITKALMPGVFIDWRGVGAYFSLLDLLVAEIVATERGENTTLMEEP